MDVLSTECSELRGRLQANERAEAELRVQQLQVGRLGARGRAGGQAGAGLLIRCRRSVQGARAVDMQPRGGACHCSGRFLDPTASSAPP